MPGSSPASTSATAASRSSSGTSASRRGSRSTVEVRARRRNRRPTTRNHVRDLRRQRRHTNSLRPPDDERVRPRQQRERCSRARASGRLDVERRDRHVRRPPLQLGQTGSVLRQGAQTVDRVGREDHHLAREGSPLRGPSPLDDAVAPGQILARRPRPCSRALGAGWRSPPPARLRPRGRASRRAGAPRELRAPPPPSVRDRRAQAPARTGARAGASASSCSKTYGGFETTRSNGPPRSPPKSWRSRRTSRPGSVGVRARDRERVVGGVDRRHARTGMLVGDRQRDRSGARAGVEHLRGVDSSQELEAALHDRLGAGARDQHARVDRERQPAEPPLPEDVGGRLAQRPPVDERAVRLLLPARKLALRIEVELGARPPERLAGEKLGVEPGGVDPARRKPPGRFSESLADGDACGVATSPRANLDSFAVGFALGSVSHCSSAWRRSSAVSASVTSSSSPSRIRSFSWCTVSLIRWSVRRFSGKL